jgi:hypothetical protein
LKDLDPRVVNRLDESLEKEGERKKVLMEEARKMEQKEEEA